MSDHSPEVLRLVWSAPAAVPQRVADPETAAILASMGAIVREHRREEAIATRLDAYRRTGVVGAATGTDRIETSYRCLCAEADHDAAF